MATDSGDNSSEVQADLEAARAAGNEEVVRYLERVLEDRKVRKAPVTSTDIILGNKDAYPDHTVEQQEQLADGRPVDPVKFEDLGVRGAAIADAGAVEADDDAKPAAKRAPRRS